jgi:signal transduction histidine kinase/CheY-like chemotaxis protein
VFIGTNNGLYKYRSDTGGLKHYGLRDGFLGVETNGNAVGYDHEGGIWFGTVRGAVRYDSSFESVNALPPQLHLTGVSVHLKPVEIVSSATFRYDQNHITFEFVGVSLKNADKVLYECRLLGADREPVVTTNRRFITYSNLPPGEYTFQVRARNEDDVWTPEPLQYSFSIHAPFWMMWWFEPLSILLVMGIVAGGYGLRARTMARLNIVLEETVHERTEELTLRNLDVEKANRALEGALRAATQASEAKAIFLANMSHEIRTPLNGVIGMTDLLLDTELGEEQTEYAHTVRDSGRALLAIINDVLDFSKIEAGKLEIDMVEFDLSQQLVTILRILSRPAHKKELELWCEVSPDVPGRVIGDALRTSQVLTNLLGNAVKFTESGCVTLNIDLMETSPDRLRLRFRVTDTGIGIPEAKLSEIFAAFSQADSSTTRRFGGTGLGLAISSRLVELMGGCLTVESQPHQGTTFEFSLPLRHAEGAVPPRPHDIAGKRVLVAVESALARSILERTLVAWEARVVVTDPTSDAWQGPAPPGAGEDQVDVVIVDGGQMGNHPSPALERIRQDDCFSRSATIHLTRRDRWQGGVSGESARVETLLPRPFTPADLVSALEYSLRSVQAGKIVTRKVLTATRPTGPTLSILLVEDNPVNQRVASGLLTRQGHRVSIAGNGREALEILEAGGCFDLVFMDVQMPEMDGLEATRAIREGEREGGPHLPIVAMTAHAVKGDREKCISAGMDDYLTKPIDMREVRRVLAVYCPSEGEEGAQGPHQAGPGALA